MPLLRNVPAHGAGVNQAGPGSRRCRLTARAVTFVPSWRLKTAASFNTDNRCGGWKKSAWPCGVAANHPPNRLLFPSYRTGQEAMVTDFRKLLDAVAVRAGWKPGEIRSKMFRHSYCAARLQTLDQGAPVSEYLMPRSSATVGTPW